MQAVCPGAGPAAPRGLLRAAFAQGTECHLWEGGPRTKCHLWEGGGRAEAAFRPCLQAPGRGRPALPWCRAAEAGGNGAGPRSTECCHSAISTANHYRLVSW